MEIVLFWTAIVIVKIKSLFTSKGLIITIKQENWLNYTKIRIYGPTLHTKESLTTLDGGKYLRIGVSFDTGFYINSGDILTVCNFKLLGIGVGFEKQTGY